VNYSNDNTATDLYLVRLWRLRPREDGAASFHGKLQHVVSGASCYFEKLSDLPEALEKMLSQEADLISPDANSEAMDGEETDAVPGISPSS
jgi:hypothetical protein